MPLAAHVSKFVTEEETVSQKNISSWLKSWCWRFLRISQQSLAVFNYSEGI